MYSGEIMPADVSAIDTSGSDRQSGTTVQSVDRALQILELIGQAGSAGVSELALQLGVHKSTVSRLIGSLEARGFVEQVPGGRGYRIGFTVVRLAGTTAAKLDLNKYGQDVCNQVAAELLVPFFLVGIGLSYEGQQFVFGLLILPMVAIYARSPHIRTRI